MQPECFVGTSAAPPVCAYRQTVRQMDTNSHTDTHAHTHTHTDIDELVHQDLVTCFVYGKATG